jgi:hypothetical protein
MHRALQEKYARALTKAQSRFKIFLAAQEAHKSGDIQTAALLYTRVAVSRYVMAEHKAAAKNALEQLKKEARKEFKDIEQNLWASSILGGGSLVNLDEVEGLVSLQFDKLEQVVRAYRTVPVAGDELARDLEKLKAAPMFAAVLNEPMAAELWERGREHERGDETCCAFLAYREAVKYLPARSAVAAEQRLTAFKANSRVVASAARCEKVRECQKLYDRAMRLTKSNVAADRAKSLFEQVVSNAPEGSAVGLAAREQLR